MPARRSILVLDFWSRRDRRRVVAMDVKELLKSVRSVAGELTGPAKEIPELLALSGLRVVVMEDPGRRTIQLMRHGAAKPLSVVPVDPLSVRI